MENILILFQQILIEFLPYLDSTLTNGGYRVHKIQRLPKGVSGVIF